MAQSLALIQGTRAAAKTNDRVNPPKRPRGHRGYLCVLCVFVGVKPNCDRCGTDEENGQVSDGKRDAEVPRSRSRIGLRSVPSSNWIRLIGGKQLPPAR